MEKEYSSKKGISIKDALKDVPDYIDKRNDYSIKAKPTLYNAINFRSRLEARWAVFFDNLGIDYDYEPETFKVPNGDQYTPDFYLPHVYGRDEKKGIFLEIKHGDWSKTDDKKIESVFKGSDQYIFLMIGEPLKNIWPFTDDDYNHYHYNEGSYQLGPYWDDNMKMIYCENCDVLKIEFVESNYRECPKCRKSITTNIELQLSSLYARGYKFKYNG